MSIKLAPENPHIWWPYANWHKAYCIDKWLTPEELEEFYHLIEEETGLVFHLHDPEASSIIHGIISSSQWQNYCKVCNQECGPQHHAIIVSLYTEEKKPGNGDRLFVNNHHHFKIPNHKKAEIDLERAHQRFLELKK